MNKILSTFIVLISFIGTCNSAQINNIFESVAKVKAGNSSGTAGCINIDDRYTYWVTNFHVVERANNINLLMYRAGHESLPIPAERIWTAYRNNEPVDICLLRVSKSSLGGWLPTEINFEYDGDLLNPGDTCLTVGCPEATWPKANRGHITKVGNGVYYITPTVIPGQSGSVLFNGDGTKAIGLIAWYEGNYGKAMTAQTIQMAVAGKQTNYYFKQPYNLENQPFLGIPVQCGPFGCPNGPFQQRPREPRQPFRQRPPDEYGPPNDGPLRPRNPYKNEPNIDPNQPNIGPDQPPDGIKIFPTYPGDPNDEFVPEDNAPKAPDTEPKVEPKNLLDEYKKENSENLSSLDDRLKKVEKYQSANEESRQNLILSIDKIQKVLPNITKQIEEFEDKIPKDVVNLDQLKETNDYVKSVQDNIDIIKKEFGTDLSNYSNDIGSKVSDVEKTLKDAAIKLISLEKQAVSYETKIETNNNSVKEVYKEILSDKNSDRYFTLGGISIPWAVLALLGYWYRRHFGGTAPSPFPKPGKAHQ